MEIKFLKKGLKINKEYYSCWYSLSSNKNVINVYLRNCKRLPLEFRKVFDVKNDTDLMTDYFESDTIRINQNNEYYNRVKNFVRG